MNEISIWIESRVLTEGLKYIFYRLLRSLSISYSQLIISNNASLHMTTLSIFSFFNIKLRCTRDRIQ